MKILLGICGSIAAYKAFDLCRGLVNAGHQVKVVLTQGATHFVKPEVFSYLGALGVYTAEEDFLRETSPTLTEDRGPVLHITLANWCDRFVVAPLSANTLAKMSRGEANDLLTSIFLALGDKPLILYPAMNTRMLNHPFTQENMKRLQGLPHVFLYPSDSGNLVCGDLGEGKFPSVEAILESIPVVSFKRPAQRKSVLITAGATISSLDPVRYLTNPSSGKTGLHLAKRFLEEGHQVTMISGIQASPLFAPLLPLPNFELKTVISASDMEREVLKTFPHADIYISAAAICDLEFDISPGKMKKEQLTSGQIPYTKSPDILKKVLELRTPGQKVIGFAAETDPSPDVLREKWERKPVDLLVGNKVHSGLSSGKGKGEGEGETPRGFGTEEGLYYFVMEGNIIENKKMTKAELSDEIYQWTTRKAGR